MAVQSNSIVDFLDEDINDFLGLGDLSHQDKTACMHLCDKPPRRDGADLVRLMLERIDRNCSASRKAGGAKGSQAWRWKKNTTLSKENQSIEVRIERAMACLLVPPDDWANQVPTASGLTNANERRRSIDIVHRHTPVEFDFIELKAISHGGRLSGHQTPLSAAMELLKYGLIFHYCKTNRKILYPDTTANRPVLDATTVHLEVLATPNCYMKRTEPFRIAWLNQLLESGLMELNRRPDAEISFDFAFRRFPDNFEWTDSDHHQLLDGKQNIDRWNALQNKMQTAVLNREPAKLA